MERGRGKERRSGERGEESKRKMRGGESTGRADEKNGTYYLLSGERAGIKGEREVGVGTGKRGGETRRRR